MFFISFKKIIHTIRNIHNYICNCLYNIPLDVKFKTSNGHIEEDVNNNIKIL
jgi:hypothetical protein